MTLPSLDHQEPKAAKVQSIGLDVNRPFPPDPYSLLAAVPSIALQSADFRDGGPLPVECSADGDARSPELSWAGAPVNTESYAVTCFDPDAPRPAGFWHWLVLGLPASVSSLPSGAGSATRVGLPPTASVLVNDAGFAGYAGARPPKGDHPHRYFFAVHALDVERIPAPLGAKAADVAPTLVPHTIARGVLVGTYQR